MNALLSHRDFGGPARGRVHVEFVAAIVSFDEVVKGVVEIALAFDKVWRVRRELGQKSVVFDGFQQTCGYVKGLVHRGRITVNEHGVIQVVFFDSDEENF